MKKEEIQLSDWSRMLLGEVPPEFFVELLLRMAFLYLLLIMSLRVLGKRMSSQLTRNELAALVSLAAAIGVPILAPDRGLLPALVIVLLVVSVNRLLSLLTFKNEKAETLLAGEMDTLIVDGILQVKTMTRTRITRERVLAQLRSQKIMHLGEVQRLYMEANGSFTLIKADKPRPGLSALPEQDKEFTERMRKADVLVCKACGTTNPTADFDLACPNCRHRQWLFGMEKQRNEQKRKDERVIIHSPPASQSRFH